MNGFKVEVKGKDVGRLVTEAGRIRLLTHLSTVATQMLQQKVQTVPNLLQWRNLVSTYLRGIDPTTPGSLMVDANHAVITLLKPPGSGMDPNILEQGCGPFSIKEALLRSHTDGVNVPFRHGAPGKSTHMYTMQKDAFRYVVDEARKLAASKPVSSGKQARGVTAIGPRLGTANLKHKTSIYSDMEIVKEKSSGSMYQTFRRVTKNSSSDWMHPGFQRLDLFGQVAEEMRKNVNKYAEPMLKLLLGGD